LKSSGRARAVRLAAVDVEDDRVEKPLTPMLGCPFFIKFRGPKTLENRPRKTMACEDFVGGDWFF